MEIKEISIDYSVLGSDLKKKFDKLIEWFKIVGGPIVVSFSGGVDSSVVLATAVYAIGRENVVAVTAISPTYPEEDLYWAKEIAKILNVKHILIESDELEDPNFISNPFNRCYYCKKSLSKSLLEIAKKLNAKVIVDGTNASDLNTHRPGYLAFREKGIRSPLAEVGITKDETRLLAKALGLPNWDKPPMACLASRIPYGEIITVEKLKRIAEAEKIVKKLTGVSLVRVRDHGYIARIEVYPNERRKFFNEKVMDSVALELQKLGYRYVTLDLLGYRSGSLDELLPKKIIPTQVNQ
ncbi:MAG: ATP-dependent sacrificial sulfur transferase LarE [Desulfurococcaceae archaeon]|nr:ATP-dependent sacrificial sulfur transferase LarE [Desulfurococcaceae archaeon]